eukprot:scaffold267355_cov32-Tisochrysis_lutea.AAC.3
MVPMVRAPPRREGRAEEHRVADLSHHLVDRRMRREGGMPAVMPHDKHAPHEESAGKLERKEEKHLREVGQRAKGCRCAEGRNGPNAHCDCRRVPRPEGHRRRARELEDVRGQPRLDLAERG